MTSTEVLSDTTVGSGGIIGAGQDQGQIAVQAGGAISFFGANMALQTNLAAGATGYVLSGAVASGITLAAGATLVEIGGGTAPGLSGPGTVVSATGSLVRSGGLLLSAFFGAVSGVTVSGEDERALFTSGAVVHGLVATDLGTVVVSSGAVVSGAKLAGAVDSTGHPVIGGGELLVSNGGTALADDARRGRPVCGVQRRLCQRRVGRRPRRHGV